MDASYQPNPGQQDFTVQNWPWGPFGTRIGSTRSADGVIFDLPQGRSRFTNNNNVVMKLIFSDNTSPRTECQITTIMSEHRLGPKFYAAYEANISPAIWNAWSTQILSTPSLMLGGRINLFQNYATHSLEVKRFSKVYVIIMENLYNNPERGVIECQTVSDIVTDRALRWNIPKRQIRDKIDKMHELGIVHGDMHTGNIIIQKIRSPNGTIRYAARIIDFGRSIMASPMRNNNSANRTLARLPGTRPGIGGSHNTTQELIEYLTAQDRVPRLRNSKAWLRISQYVNRRNSYVAGSAHVNYERSRQQSAARRSAARNAAARNAAARNAAARNAAARNAAARNAAERNAVASEVRARHNTSLGQRITSANLNNYLANRMNWSPTSIRNIINQFVMSVYTPGMSHTDLRNLARQQSQFNGTNYTPAQIRNAVRRLSIRNRI